MRWYTAVVTKLGRPLSESLFFGGFRAIAASGERVPLSPPKQCSPLFGVICRSDFSAFATRGITGLLFPLEVVAYFDLNNESGSCCSKINLDKGRVRVSRTRLSGTAPQERRGHSASILRARTDHAPHRGGNEKPDLYAVISCTKVRTYNALPRYRTAAKDISDPLERFRFASGLRPQGGDFSVADPTTSFSLKFSLPPSWWLLSRSSLPSSLSWPCRPLQKTCLVNMRLPCIGMRNTETVSQMQS